MTETDDVWALLKWMKDRGLSVPDAACTALFAAATLVALHVDSEGEKQSARDGLSKGFASALDDIWRIKNREVLQ